MTDIEVCLWCDEPLIDGEEAVDVPCIRGMDITLESFHRNCKLRSVYGSVGHIMGRCSCFGGNEEDPPELTKRQAADLAVKMFNAIHDIHRRTRSIH